MSNDQIKVEQRSARVAIRGASKPSPRTARATPPPRWNAGPLIAKLGPQSYVHGLGDGATGIMNAFEEQFGAQGKYTVDFWGLDLESSKAHSLSRHSNAGGSASLPTRSQDQTNHNCENGANHTCKAANVPDQRPRAADVRIATQTRSRGSLHPVCWALVSVVTQ